MGELCCPTSTPLSPEAGALPQACPEMVRVLAEMAWPQHARGVGMSPGERNNKITPEHLRKNAYLYIRQSTLHQVLENTESTRRQYELRQRAVVLGWPEERIVVIDSDSANPRFSQRPRGFQRLVGESARARGHRMGLEVSRLARNSSDWHRLLEFVP